MSGHRGREFALNVGAVLGLLCIVAAAVSMFLGITPLIFRSGSMAPTIHTGALGLARSVPADQLQVGDIVSVDDPTGVRITHRIVGVDPAADGGAVDGSATSVTSVTNGSASIRLRGDANNAEDPAPYVVSEADRVFFHVDYLGYAVAWLTNPVAIFLGGMLAGGLMVVAFGRTRMEPLGEAGSAGGGGGSAGGADSSGGGDRQDEEVRGG